MQRILESALLHLASLFHLESFDHRRKSLIVAPPARVHGRVQLSPVSTIMLSRVPIGDLRPTTGAGLLEDSAIDREIQ